MSFPMMHPRPPEITQGAQTCWAASFEAWQAGNSSLIGIQPTTSQAQLIEWLESGSGLTYESGRATPEGMMLMAGIGMMSLKPVPPARATIQALGDLLEAGYLYIVYFRRPGTPAHAVVCYGVDHEGIHLMDPMPDRGIITVEPDFFTAMTEGAVLVGFPLDVALARQVGQALQQLQPPPVSSAIF